MKKLLPILLILLGAVEIVLAVLEIKIPLPIAIVLGVIFIVLGIKTLLDQVKR